MADDVQKRPTGARRPSARDPAAGYRRIAWSLILLVLVPSSLLLGVGVLLLMRGSPSWNLVLGILVITFVGLLATGITLVWVFLYKEQNLSQLQTDFVSKISHELRTPLTSIRLFAETLELRRGSPEQQDECLTLLKQETERLTGRIDRLLEWGRMEAGRRLYVLEQGEVGEVAREAVAHFTPLRLQKDVELSVTVEENLPKVLIDRGALAEAITNLLSNAYKYGGKDRKIELTVDSIDERALVRIVVADHGDGIPAREHKRIFQKFYRRDDRLSRMAEGSGLGLALVAHIVKGHNGRVSVESDVGHGARFIIELPTGE